MADVIIELLSPNPVRFENVELILATVNPKLFIPSWCGADIATADIMPPGFLLIKTVHSENARKLGIKTLDVITGLFAIPSSSVYEFVEAVGIGAKKKTVTQTRDFSIRIASSKEGYIARATLSAATGDLSRLFERNFYSER